jgi:hypothetical protein
LEEGQENFSEAMISGRNAASPRPAVQRAPTEGAALGRVFSKDPARPEVAAESERQGAETDKLLRQTADLLNRLREAVTDAEGEDAG